MTPTENTATSANKEAVRAFMSGNVTVTKKSPPQGVMSVDQTFRFISLQPGRYGVLWEYARDYGLTLTDNAGKPIWGCENPQEPEIMRRRIFRRLVATETDIQTALNEMFWKDHQGLRDGVTVESPEVWARMNSAGLFGGRVIADLDESGKPTGRAPRSTGPNHALSALATAAEAVAWRRVLGIREVDVSPLLGKQRFDTFIGPFKSAVTGEVKVVFEEAKVAESESDFRLFRNLGEKRQPAALPDRFATTATRAAAMRAVVSSTTTSTTATTTVVAAAPAPATPMEAVASAAFMADLTTAVAAGRADVTTLTEYVALTQKIKALQEEAAAFLAKVKGE